MLPALLLATGAAERWPAEAAWEWSRRQPWIVGCNYVPSTAGNTTEFWAAETADPAAWDRELGWAADLGYNTVRVFIQFLVWKHDPKGLRQRLDEFCAVAQRHGLKVVPVPFDDCSFGAPPRPEPVLGPQGELIPGVLMPLWTPSPGLSAVEDRRRWPDLEAYLTDLVAGFGQDPRILFWDLYNEPGNSGLGNRSLPLMEACFGWARAARPSQPLSIGVWGAPAEISQRQLDLSDITTFHAYTDAAGMRQAIERYRELGRPVVCTEFLARLRGGNWEADLPVLREAGVGALAWGLVRGRTQTQFAWDSQPGSPEPTVWFHDLFEPDGTPYNPREIRIIRTGTGRATPWYATGTVLPTSRTGPATWRMTTETPPAGWAQPGFDDAGWSPAPAPFGTLEPQLDRRPSTPWTTGDLWLRRRIELPARPVEPVAALLHHDESVELYLNGVEILRTGGYNAAYQMYDLRRLEEAWRPGPAVLAAHVRQMWGGQYFDVGLVNIQPMPAPPAVRPMLDEPLRDPSICRGPDGWYYLTGTTGWPTWWDTNDGIRLHRSRDLAAWEPLGLVWSFERDATWQAEVRDGKRAIWAPEIHYLRGTWWLTYCLNWPGGGTGILRSASGRAEGPYVDVKPDGPLTGEIDASLFEDVDGSVYLVWQNGRIARLTDDLSGLAEPPRELRTAAGEHVGFEGAALYRIDGRYHLIAADFTGDPVGYHCLAASSDRLYGPYSERYVAVTHGGHNTLFRDAAGRWYSTFFGNDPYAPFRERAAILRVELDGRGRLGASREADG